jgi:3-oxoacyl-[acyl-carrier protein] reductase
MGEFQGQIVAVTGAGAGIGEACAAMFARENATVIALDIDEKGLASLAARLQGEGWPIATMRLDISDESSVQGVFERIEKEYGRLDVLVNSAGIISFEKFPDHSQAGWDKVMNVNIRGTYFCSRFAGMMMRRQQSGAIVNISAGAAKTGGMNPSPAYIASKGGINSLTFHFAVQLAKDHVRVNAICPGPIDTSMIEKQAHLPGTHGNGKENIIAAVPLGLGQPDDIAYGVLFLASNRRARYITGEILDINGGLVMD